MSFQQSQKCETKALQGTQELLRGNLQKAWLHFQSACDSGCQNKSSVHIGFGGIYEKQYFFDKAFAAFDYAISCDPFSPQAYNNRGRMYLITQQIKLALLDFQKTIKLQPNNARAYFNLGGVYLQQKHLEKSLMFFQKAKELGYTPADQVILDVKKQISTPTYRAETVPLSAEEEQMSNAFILAKFAYSTCGRNLELSVSEKKQFFGLHIKKETLIQRNWDTSIEKLYEFDKDRYQGERLGATLEFFKPSNFLIRIISLSPDLEELSLWKKHPIKGVPHNTFSKIDKHTWQLRQELLSDKLLEIIETGIVKKSGNTLIY